MKRKKVYHYMRNIGSDIIFLQETHSDKKRLIFFWKINSAGSQHGFVVFLQIAGELLF